MVDNRRFHRLAFRVLDHDPTQADIRAFLATSRLHWSIARWCAWHHHGRLEHYPEVLKELWPGRRHRICIFHVFKEIPKAVLRRWPSCARNGRPDPQVAAWPTAPAGRSSWRRIRRLQQRVAELFAHRYLFVKHHLSTAEKKVLKRLVRGQPQLRALRDIMDEVYRLFDRRCRTATALLRLVKLRQRVRRFKRLGRALAMLNSPMLEKALLFLDDKLLGATSNAVERGNRRFRKAQKSIYSVRSQRHVEQRLALDMNRELRAAQRARTLKTLHRPSSDPESGHH